MSATSVRPSLAAAVIFVLLLLGFPGSALKNQVYASTLHYRHPYKDPTSLDAATPSSDDVILPPIALPLSSDSHHVTQQSADTNRFSGDTNPTSADTNRVEYGAGGDVDDDDTKQPNEVLNPDTTSDVTASRNGGRIDMYVEQHEKITFKCDVGINFTNNIWLKDGEIVDTVPLEHAREGGGHRYLRDKVGGLHINNVRLEDDGKWQCEAEDALGLVVTAKPIHLTVLEAPRAPYLVIDGRRLDAGNVFVPVREEAALALRCVAEGGHPSPRLAWRLLPSPSLLVNTQVNNLTVLDEESGGTSSGSTVSEARLRVLRAHHNATIACHVHHAALRRPLHASLLLDVQYTPSFAISREPGFGIPVLEGMPVSLKCEVDANPSANGVWRRDDAAPPVAQSQDGFLNFSAIKRDHSGWYKCTAKHPQGTFSSIGYYLNVRYEAGPAAGEPQQWGVERGVVTGTPHMHAAVAAVAGVGGGGGIGAPGGSGGLGGGLGNGQPMPNGSPIRNVQVAVSNAVQMQCPPGHPSVQPRNQTVVVAAGGGAVLQVEFCASPGATRAVWMTNTHVFRPGLPTGAGRIRAHDLMASAHAPHCHVAQLSIESARSRDHGEYSFIVRSAAGIAEGVVFVNVTGTDNFNATNSASASSTCSVTYVTAMFAYFWLMVVL